ncbi:MAG: phosphatidylglycerophosphatase A [Betaproteobacteria bacterium]|nr:phosphatidylglycerophosphatase A [Betaproteobacteria bacterium]
MRPDVRFMLRHPAHLVALGGGAGLVPGAPGTAGTLLALPLHWWLAPQFSALTWLAVIAAAFGIGIWACGRTGRVLGAPDHGAIVWDEIIAFLLVLVFTPAGYLWQAFAFLLFRLFDILKPPPIRYFDRKWKNGFGVMFDDLLAACYSLLVLAGARILIAE